VNIHTKAVKPLIYFSGVGSSGGDELELIKQGAKYRCYSYAYACRDGFYYQKSVEKAMKTSLENNVGIMMDSGAASFHGWQKKGLRKVGGKFSVRDEVTLRDGVIKNYVKYVKQREKDWDFYLTFDYVKQCPVIYGVQKRLEKLGINPVPVFHGDEPIDWFKRYCEEGHKLICLGSVRRSNKNYRVYFDRVFNMAEKYGVLLHGLAITSLSLMFGFPWYSVDSATWAKVAAFGCVLTTSDTVNDTFGYIHMSNKRHGQSRGIEYCELDKFQKKQLERVVNDDGFDVKDLVEDGAKRSLYNIYVFSHKIAHLKADLNDSRQKWKSLLV